MNYEDHFQLGIISKAYSFKGEIILFIDSDIPENYYNLDFILLEINKQLVPHFITSKKVHKHDRLRIRLEGIESSQEVNLILKKKVYLPIKFLPKLGNQQFYYHEIIDYKVFDEKTELIIGSILDIIENPNNTLIELNYKNKDILLPLNDSTFIKIDKQNKIINLSLPEGLLDI